MTDGLDRDWIKAEQAKGWRPSPLTLTIFIIVGGVMLLIAALAVYNSTTGNNTDSDTDTAYVADTSKYNQTWQTDYASTTCDDWLSQMTSSQRFAASADILTSARNKIDGGRGLPSDSLIDEFTDGLDNVCVIPSMTLTDASYGLYTTEPRFSP